jgi:hypothetical protein
MSVVVVDPFGHAATQASLFAQMGFDGTMMIPYSIAFIPCALHAYAPSCHSRDHPLSFFFYSAFFFGRIEYTEHAIRNATKELEFVWRGSQSLGKKTEIFTHVLYST